MQFRPHGKNTDNSIYFTILYDKMYNTGFVLNLKDGYLKGEGLKL